MQHFCWKRLSVKFPYSVGKDKKIFWIVYFLLRLQVKTKLFGWFHQAELWNSLQECSELLQSQTTFQIECGDEGGRVLHYVSNYVISILH